jgi:hypothetical protein
MLALAKRDALDITAALAVSSCRSLYRSHRHSSFSRPLRLSTRRDADLSGVDGDASTTAGGDAASTAAAAVSPPVDSFSTSVISDATDSTAGR